MFLNDTSEKVVNEAAHAIHDEFSIPAAMPSLAGCSTLALPPANRCCAVPSTRTSGLVARKTPCAWPSLPRAKNAPEAMRVEALRTLSWPSPFKLDRVEGRFRDLAHDLSNRRTTCSTNTSATCSPNQTPCVAPPPRRSANSTTATPPSGSPGWPTTIHWRLRSAPRCRGVHSIDADGADVVAAAALKAESPELRATAVRVLAKRN